MSLTASSMQNKDSESRKEIELREVKDTVTHDVVHSKYHTYIIVFLLLLFCSTIIILLKNGKKTFGYDEPIIYKRV